MHEVPRNEPPILPVLDGVSLIPAELAELVATGRQHDADGEDGKDRQPLAESANGDSGGSGNAVCLHNHREPLVLSSVRLFGS